MWLSLSPCALSLSKGASITMPRGRAARTPTARPPPVHPDALAAEPVDEPDEIDEERLTPRIATVALDLLRHEMLMTLRPVPEETIAEIVDDIFLPLVRRTSEA